MIRRASALIVLFATLAAGCSSPTAPTPAPSECPIVTNGSTRC